MRPNVFRGRIWTQLRRWLAVLYGISWIVMIARAAGVEMLHVWPTWDLSIYGMMVVGVVVLSWAWFKVVEKAIKAGEYD
jgi:hypothetical protein